MAQRSLRPLLLLLASLPTLTEALRNQALVFLKPHAATDACEAFVRDHLSKASVSVVSAGTKVGVEIEECKLIDQHYGSLAKLAMETEPAQIALQPASKAAFAETFEIEWEDALPSMMRNDKALTSLGVDGVTLENMWRGGLQLKLAPGTYISRLAQEREASPIYTVNGFYPAMRQAFVEPKAEVRYLVCEFEESKLSWQAFRQEVIGATNPEHAESGSVRAKILESWEELGLAEPPTQGFNGVHASAGPLEGLKERCVWAGATLNEDVFGSRLIAGGVALETLEAWLEENPVVTFDGKTDKIFDLTEEMDTSSVLDLVLPKRAPAYSTPAPAGFVWGSTY